MCAAQYQRGISKRQMNASRQVLHWKIVAATREAAIVWGSTASLCKLALLSLYSSFVDVDGVTEISDSC